jgi:hypothetical protein
VISKVLREGIDIPPVSGTTQATKSGRGRQGELVTVSSRAIPPQAEGAAIPVISYGTEIAPGFALAKTVIANNSETAYSSPPDSLF